MNAIPGLGDRMIGTQLVGPASHLRWSAGRGIHCPLEVKEALNL